MMMIGPHLYSIQLYHFSLSSNSATYTHAGELWLALMKAFELVNYFADGCRPIEVSKGGKSALKTLESKMTHIHR